MPDAQGGADQVQQPTAGNRAISWISSRLPRLSGPSWRVSAASRLESLERDLKRADNSAHLREVHEAIEERIEDAWHLLGPHSLATDTAVPGDHLSRTAIRRSNLSRDRSSGVAKSIHRGEELLVLIARDDDFRTRAQRIREQFADQPLDARDRNVSKWLAFLEATTTKPADYKYQPRERELLRSILEFLNLGAELADEGIRGFRNTLGAMGALLLATLVIVAIVAAFGPGLFSLCTPASTSPTLCPSGSTPGSGDVAGVELMGALGGLISAIVVYANLEGKPNAHLIQLVQALIKLPVGAAVSLTVIELMQQGALTGLGLLAPQPGARVLGLAVLFGFAQQAATQALDQYAGRLLRASPARGDMPAMSGS